MKAVFSRLLTPLLMLVPVGFSVACGADDDTDTDRDVDTTTAPNNTAPGSTGEVSSAGMATNEMSPSNIDYTRCEPRPCDPEASVDFDFSGPWNETIVFKSNDCDASLQGLVPPGFMLEGAILTDVIVGNCIMPEPGSGMFTGSVALDLSRAEYCTRAMQPVLGQGDTVELVSHVTWDSIKEGSISGTTAVYVAFAGCTMRGDYSLVKPGPPSE